MASRKIEDLTTRTREKYQMFSTCMAKAGIPFDVTCTSRTDLEQVALYCQGRVSLRTVNRIRRLAALPLIMTKENAHRVTWTLKSRHIVHDDRPLSDAFDIALMRDKQIHWDIKADVNDNEIPDYLEAAKIAQECGLVAGAFFKGKPDYCHFQDTD